MDCSLPGSSVHGILQARILELIHIPYQKSRNFIFFTGRNSIWKIHTLWMLEPCSPNENISLDILPLTVINFPVNIFFNGWSKTRFSLLPMSPLAILSFLSLLICFPLSDLGLSCYQQSSSVRGKSTSDLATRQCVWAVEMCGARLSCT